MILRSFLILFTTMALAGAQGLPSFLPQGGILMAGNSLDRVAILPTGGGPAVNLVPNVGDAPNVVIWDPQNPDDILIGGNAPYTGWIARMSFISATQYTVNIVVPTTGAIGGSANQAMLLRRPEQVSWSQTGQELIVADGQTNALLSLDPVTGAESLIFGGSPTPWSGAVTAGVQHPLTGDYFVGTSTGQIWRISNVATGLQASLFQSYGPNAIRKMVVDDQFSGLPGSPVFLAFTQLNALRRIDLGTLTTETFFSGTPGNIQSLAIDHQGDLVYGRDIQNAVDRVLNQAADPMGMATIIPVGNASSHLGNAHCDLDVIGSTTRPFRLTMQSFPPGSGLIAIANYPSNADQGWLLLSAATSLPRDSGPFFGLLPDPLSLFCLGQPALPGSLLHFGGGVPPSGPLNPFFIPAFTMTPVSGQTWDGVAITFDAAGNFLGRTNVARVTW